MNQCRSKMKTHGRKKILGFFFYGCNTFVQRKCLNGQKKLEIQFFFSVILVYKSNFLFFKKIMLHRVKRVAGTLVWGL